jgi:hypothetical protein
MNKTMYYISFLASDGLTSVWCTLSTLLVLQRLGKERGWETVEISVMTRHHLVGAVDEGGIFQCITDTRVTRPIHQAA